MSMLRHIRSLPKQTQAHVAFVIAFVLAVVVTLLWIPTLPARFAETKDAVTEVSEQAEAKTGIGSAFKDLASSTAQIRDALKVKEIEQQQEESSNNFSTYEPQQASTSTSAMATTSNTVIGATTTINY